MVHMLFKQGKIQDSVRLFAELQSVCKQEQHSMELSVVYGAHRMPHTISLISQHLFLVGKSDQATQLIETAAEILSKSARRHAGHECGARGEHADFLTPIHRGAESLSAFLGCSKSLSV